MRRVDNPQDIAKINKLVSNKMDAVNKELKNLRVFSQQTHHQLTHVAGQQVLTNTVGPLPISGVFTVRSAGPILMMVSGSGFTSSTNVSLGFFVNVDGTTRAATRIYFNNSATHLPVIPMFILLNLSAGSHTVQLSAGPSFSTDVNDAFNVTIIELQGSV